MSDNRVYAIRYAHRMGERGAQFYGAVERPGDPMAVSYFVWLVVGPHGAVLVDTGFSADTAARYGREYVTSPRAAVEAAGVDPDSLAAVVLSHLHYDHAGTVPDFAEARFVVQRREMAYWTGRHAAHIGSALGMSHLVLPEDIAMVAAADAEGRVDWVDGEREILPGVSVHRVGGHTPGMQVVLVETAQGPVVLASDATHFYENFERRRPYAILESVAGSLDAFDELSRLAGPAGLVVPGHDPAVLERFPDADIASLAGHAALIA
jgi:glyoxylase-like metal-dependent hydrolase (beta-lactamase superfamily II)